MSSALLIGATGAIGKILLSQLLCYSTHNVIGEYGRRVTTPTPTSSSGKALKQKTIDFEKLEGSGLKDDEPWDVVYIVLGTTKKIAGGKPPFTKIDKEYVINVAKEARRPGVKQRLVYLSSIGANYNSVFFYTRSKGQTEAELATLGYDDFIALRPAAFVNVNRSGTSREGEGLPLDWLVKRIMPSIDPHQLATALRVAGEKGTSNLPPEASATRFTFDNFPAYTVIENKGIVALANSAK